MLECSRTSIDSRPDSGRAALRARLGMALAGMAWAVTLALTPPALAGGPTTIDATNGGVLVRGGAPLPQFNIDFLNTGLGSALALPGGNGGDLTISLKSPGSSVLDMLFSPRPQLGISVDPSTGASRGYAGIAWNVFAFSGISGSLGFAGSVTQPGPEDPTRRLLGPPLALHSTFSLGYSFGGNDSLSLSLDHATMPDFLSDHSVDFDNIRLQYGVHF